MNQSPSKLIKLPFQNTTSLIKVHQFLPYMLRVGENLQNFNIVDSKVVKSINLPSEPQQVSNVSYCNKKLICVSKNMIQVDEHKNKIFNDNIAHFLTDSCGVAIAAAESQYQRCIKIICPSQQKQADIIVSQLNFHYNAVTSLYWKNSLVISGDSGGEVCLWDLNKCRVVQHRKTHYEPVRFIGTYADYNSNNVYYSLSPSQRRLVFSDLRSNKPIKIISNLQSPQIINAIMTSSGKLFIVYNDIIDAIDIHKNYSMIGNFSTLVMSNQTQMKWTSKSFSYKNHRQITLSALMGKYIIAACNNGCIQVYDTDQYQCLYGFGLVKFGPIKNIQCSQSLSSIFGLSADGQVYQAIFQPNKND